MSDNIGVLTIIIIFAVAIVIIIISITACIIIGVRRSLVVSRW